ncbi:diacylglycerol kinase family protein [Alloscardovia omnicolens]|uniref:diacylglycerol/lipid kinase family protein n=1 Tax=Alloscardovia omnicolens TaxID=419015 RepID=UPI003A64AF99
MRFHFVVNPSGGSGRALLAWREVQSIMHDKKLKYSVHFPTQTYVVQDIVRDLTNVSDADEDVYLIIVGGDGTLNVAINGIVNFKKTYIGLIPAGSGNDFVRSQSIPQSYEAVLDRITDIHRVRSLDVGVLTYNTLFDDQGRPLNLSPKHRLFNNAIGIGFDADVCVKVLHSRLSEKLSTFHLSKLAYLCAALPSIFKHRNFALDVTIDNRDYHFDDVLFAAIMNEPYEGGGFKFCPDASAYDGLLDSCIACGIKKRELIHLIPRALKGKHTTSDGVSIERGKEYRIRSSHPLWVQADGEVEYRSNDITISVRPQAIQFLGL